MKPHPPYGYEIFESKTEEEGLKELSEWCMKRFMEATNEPEKYKSVTAAYSKVIDAIEAMQHTLKHQPATEIVTEIGEVNPNAKQL